MLVQQTQSIKQGIDIDFLYPQYDGDCISRIPNVILRLFAEKSERLKIPSNNLEFESPEKANKIILLIIDGFGFHQFLRHLKGNRFLTSLTSKGQVCPLTSVFPSQTTNALTTLNTGLTPQEHGLFEYFIYLQDIGLVNAMRFERVGEKRQDKLVDEGLDPSILLLKNETIYNKMKKMDIASFTHIQESNVSAPCSRLIFQGSKIVSARNLLDSIAGLRKNIEENRGKSAYFFVHLDTLDPILHRYGPESYEYFEELSLITYLLNKELVQKIDQKVAKETLLLLTSDHGGVSIEPKNTTYLNYHPKAALNLKEGKNRKTILPTGSPRDIFLHIKEEKLFETKQWLTKKIGSRAKIIETGEAAEKGLFGSGKISTELLNRTGNLMILPFGNQAVWFDDSEHGRISFVGQHGGLNAQEMLVPFGVSLLSSLRE